MPRASETLIVLKISLIKETITAIKMLKNLPVSIIKLLSKSSRKEDLHLFHKIVERSCDLHKNICTGVTKSSLRYSINFFGSVTCILGFFLNVLVIFLDTD